MRKKLYMVWRDEDKCRDVELYMAKDENTLLNYLKKELRGDYSQDEMPDDVIHAMIEGAYVEEVEPKVV